MNTTSALPAPDDVLDGSASQPRPCGNDTIRFINGLAYSFGPRVERHDESDNTSHVEPPAPGEKPEFWGLYAWLEDQWHWRADFATETSLNAYLTSISTVPTTRPISDTGAGPSAPASPSMEIFVNGDANSYALLNGDRWIASVQMNGEFYVARQMQLLERMLAALEQEFRSQEQ